MLSGASRSISPIAHIVSQDAPQVKSSETPKRGQASVTAAAKTPRTTAWLIDVLAVLGLTLWTWRLEAGWFWHNNWVSIGWGDWAAHAYRASFFAHWGLTNWDPDWNNGLPLFQGYQTLPHVLTTWVSQITGTSITHAMMMWTAVLLLLLPVSAYLCLRWLGLGAPGALLGAALVLNNADISSPIEDFSYLFGLALIPIMVWIGLKLIGTRWGYLGAVAVGFTIYLHPYGTTVAMAVLAARFIWDRRRMLTRTVAIQAALTIAAASFYWLPYVVGSARPKYEDPWNSSLIFEQQLLAQNGFHGYSILLIVLGVATLGLLFWRGFPAHRLSVVTLMAAAFLAAVAMTSYAGLLPAAIVQIHFVRLTPTVSVLAALAAAPLGDVIWSKARAVQWRSVGRALAPVVVLALVALSLFEGRYWYDRDRVPVALDDAGGRDLVQWAADHPSSQPEVVLTNANDVAFGSYVAFGRYHYPGDYIVTRQWTVAEPILNDMYLSVPQDLPDPAGYFNRMAVLLKLYGVQYVYLSDLITANQAFVTGPLTGDLPLVEKLQDGWMAKVPWTPVAAFTAPVTSVQATTLPNLTFTTDAQDQLRWTDLQAYADLAYSGSAQPAQITWQSPTELTVSAVAGPGQALVIPQNWDTVWTATSDGRSLPVQRVGPNFIAVSLDGLSGPVSVHLVHGPYPTWIISQVVVLASLLAASVLTLVPFLRRSRSRGGSS